MSSRRRILRPTNPVHSTQRQAERIRKVRDRLAQERATLARWMKRLRRAFNAVTKAQRTINRLEKEMTPRENH